MMGLQPVDYWLRGEMTPLEYTHTHILHVEADNRIPAITFKPEGDSDI